MGGVWRIGLRALLVVLFVLGVMAEGDVAGKGEPITFQAEVNKMLDILINSLYTNRAIFIRELISNGSDALDKIRLLYLTAPKEPTNSNGEAPTLDIRISFNDEKKQLIIRDGGIGMTKDELTGHLGSLGTSGTKRFMEKMKESKDSNLIGQFGVGFYSAFLASDRVRVASKSDDSDKQWVWESTGDGKYFIYEDERGNTLGRGTEITMDIKPDALEFTNIDAVKRIVHQYSEFVHFPIYIQNEKKEKVAPKKDKKKKAEKEDKDSEDSETVPEETEDLEDAEVEEPKETVTKTWEIVNENKPIWTRKPSEVTEEEYIKFYKALAHDYRDPLFYSHFTVEGEVEFSALLFVPAEASQDIFINNENTRDNIKLYVRRIFITDEFRELLPRYLSFVKGVVDSNDLPLNVSREVLQESRILRVIKKKLVRKALGMLSEIAASDARLKAKKEKAAAEGADESTAAAKDTTAKPGTMKLKEESYPKFWQQFGKHIRLGVIDDANNRGRLTKLLRYESSKSNGTLISLEEYTDRMKPNQKAIYYLSGDNTEKIRQSPHLEDALARDIEVLFMVDAIDEYVVGQVQDFANKKLVNLAKEGAHLDDLSDREKAIEKKRIEKFKPLVKRLLTLFKPQGVSKVVLTKRQSTEPFVLSSRENEMTPRMVSIMRQQAISSGHQVRYSRVLELNHRHPLIVDLHRRFQDDEDDETAIDVAWVLFDTANLQAEFPVSNQTLYAKRVNRLLRGRLDLVVDDSLLPPDDHEYNVDDVEPETAAVDETVLLPEDKEGAAADDQAAGDL